MNMEEYLRALETHMTSRKLNLGDGDSVLSLLYETYGDINPMYDDQIKADFAELYQALNGMPLQELSILFAPSVKIMNETDLFMECRLISDCCGKCRVENNPYITPRL